MKRLLGFAMRRRGTLAMAILMTFVVAGTAFAAARGTTLKMGVTQVLTGNYVTTYAGTVSSALLYLKNSSTNAASSGLRIDTPNGGNPLDLRAKAGFAPMRVNSGTKVTNLNADRLDGIDSPALLEGQVFQSGTADLFPTLALGDNYFYPVSFTAASTGTCVVNAATQTSSGIANTGVGPFYRSAIRRGGGANTNDGTYGHYFSPTGTSVSGELSRTARYGVTAGEAIQLGVYFGGVDGDWVGDTATIRFAYSCHRGSTPGALSSSSTKMPASPKGAPAQRP